MAEVSINEYKSKFLEAVFLFLKEGVDTIDSLTVFLLAVDKEHMEQDHEKIRKMIEEADQSMSKAETAAQCQLVMVDEEYLGLTREKGSLECERTNKTTEVKNLKTTLASRNTILENSRHALEIAKRERQNAQQNLDQERAKYQEEEIKRNIGIGLLFIPLIGPIVGGTMIGVYQASMNNAMDVVKHAEAAEHKWGNEASNYSSKVTKYKDLVINMEKEISNTNSVLEEIDSKLQQLSQKRIAIADVQEKLRAATNFLSTLAGRVKVSEVQTRTVLFFDPLITILENISQHIVQLSGNVKYQLLFQQDIKPMINKLEESNLKLKAISKDEGLAMQFY
ncbi:hypothetical protein EOD39_18379 [Acipenser ruthenus]|uniref:Uncharacterized protein n=1 Tax=Acipenser ruthenus TaxID=7906 RepID=A0A444V0W6_ACIRT|nr:hypothetical protein EOD39_18379 [Acipenser ruthenus]